jgi:hypothetical protein
MGYYADDLAQIYLVSLMPANFPYLQRGLEWCTTLFFLPSPKLGFVWSASAAHFILRQYALPAPYDLSCFGEYIYISW